MARRKITKQEISAVSYGDEPTWVAGEIPSVAELATALTWYANNWEPKKSVKAFFKVFNGKKADMELLKTVESKLSPTICHLAVIASRGCALEKKHRQRIVDHVESLIGNKRAKKKPRASAVVVTTIRDRVEEKAREYIGEIQGEIDRFYFENKYKSDFNLYEWLQSNDVKPIMCQFIIDSINPMIEEFNTALSKKDDQLAESYSHVKPMNIRKTIKFLESLVEDAARWGQNKKKARKPRKKKVVAASKQLEKFKYRKDFTELKLVSVNPEQILGAQQLWVYNVQYNTLTRFNALSREGFSVKGTTLQGFDVDNSITKRIRKPKEISQRVLSGGKIVLRKLMDELNTKEQPAKGRLGEHSILLRVIR